MGSYLLIGTSGLLSQSLQACIDVKDTIKTSSCESDDSIYFDSKMRLQELDIQWDKLQYIIITSAISDVLECELDIQLSLRINLEWPLQIARDAKILNIPIICFSSEYVFDGLSSCAYDERSQHNPKSVYGRHKSILENEMVTNFEDSLVFRISKLADIQNPRSFLGKMREQILYSDVYYAATDQIFSPIDLSDAAQLIIKASQVKLTGLYNLSGPEPISRYRLASRIALKYSPSTTIKPINISDLNLGYYVPPNLSMCCDNLCTALATKISSGADL